MQMALCGAPDDNRENVIFGDTVAHYLGSNGCFCVDIARDSLRECIRRDGRRIRGCGSLQL